MKRIWGRVCLAVGLTMSMLVSSAAAESGQTYRSYTEQSLIKQDGTFWTWGSMQPVPVQIHGMDDVVTVHDGGLIQLTDGTVHYTGRLQAGQPVEPVALPQFDHLKQAMADYSQLFIVDADGGLTIVPLDSSGVTLEALQNSQPVPALEDVKKVSHYQEWDGNRTYQTIIALKEDGTLWRGYKTENGTSSFTRIPNLDGAVDLQRNVARLSNGELRTWPIREGTDSPVISTKVPINRSIAWLGTHRMANLAVDVDGRLWFWGNTVTGYSDGTEWHAQSSPIRFSALSDVREAYVVERMIFALTKQGELYATSLNRQSMPADASFDLMAKDVRSVQAGSRHLMMERQDGTLWGWGVNKSAELGVGDFTFMYDKPVPLLKPVSVVLNGQSVPLTGGALLHDGQAFIPLRSVFERLGATLTWDVLAKETLITGAANGEAAPVQIRIGFTTGEVTIQDKPVLLPSKPFIIGSVSYVPLRLVSESLGATVHWSSEARAVQITYPGKTN
ncbi:stalk domain-containing protein [Paenibacillus daejeonensis]|uniref:stalk domain-containing protein n=1 Tax=Paenibacillus daejeonensis TaxID=135193 RepID=UPI00037E7980|nr:stalk domain-containing protein [Paenibacillus daejeonensis]